MPVIRKEHEGGWNVSYHLQGSFSVQLAREFLDLNIADYNQVGDALGAIIDISQMRLSISGLRAAQDRLNGVVFDVPVAFVGRPNGMLITFLKGLEALTSRGRARFSFFTSEAEALDWLNGWWAMNGKDREALRGVKSTKVE